MNETTIVKAACPMCGDVDLKPHQILLQISDVPGHQWYEFECPACGHEVRKPAGAQVRDLLQSADVRVRVLNTPAEALEPHTGPTITLDDVITMHNLLTDERAAWAAITDGIERQ